MASLVASRTVGSSSPLVAFRRGALADPRPFPAFELPHGTAILVGCGRFRDEIVLLLEGDYPIVVVVDRAGQVQKRIELPESSRFTWVRVAHYHPELTPFGGELTRFVPLYVEPRGRPHRLAIVDLARGTVAYGRELPSDTLHKVFRRDERWYVDQPGRYLAVIDGATGRIDAAVATNEDDGVEPEQLAGGRVWLYPKLDPAPLDRSQVTVLDAATLDIVHQGAVAVHEATVLARGELGLP